MNLEIYNAVVWAIVTGIHLPNLIVGLLDHWHAKQELRKTKKELVKVLRENLAVHSDDQNLTRR